MILFLHEVLKAILVAKIYKILPETIATHCPVWNIPCSAMNTSSTLLGQCRVDFMQGFIGKRI